MREGFLILITRRGNDFHACIKDRPEIWGCGHSDDAAVGNMIMAHYDIFSVRFQYSKSHA